MKCEEVREQLSAWLDNELDADASAAVAAHVDHCGACHREWCKLRALDAALSDLVAPVPSDVAVKVLARVKPSRRWVQSVALAACLILGIALGGSMARSFYTPTAPNGTASEVASLDAFQDFPQGSLGTILASYQPDETNGTLR